MTPHYPERMYRLFQPSVDDHASTLLPHEMETRVVHVFALVGEAIAGATHALLTSDRELAKRIVENDEVIDDEVNAIVAWAEDQLMNNAELSAPSRRMLLTLLRHARS